MSLNVISRVGEFFDPFKTLRNAVFGDTLDLDFSKPALTAKRANEHRALVFENLHELLRGAKVREFLRPLELALLTAA